MIGSVYRVDSDHVYTWASLGPVDDINDRFEYRKVI